MCLRSASVVPVFAETPMPRKNRNAQTQLAKLTQTYFRPWTAVEDCGDAITVHVGSLGPDGSWAAACRAWLLGGVHSSTAATY